MGVQRVKAAVHAILCGIRLYKAPTYAQSFWKVGQCEVGVPVEIPIYRGGPQQDKPLAGLIRTLVLLASHEMIQMTGVV